MYYMEMVGMWSIAEMNLSFRNCSDVSNSPKHAYQVSYHTGLRKWIYTEQS